MPGVLGSGKLPLDFQSLSVRVRGEATAAVASLLQSDWQRQMTDWTVTHDLSVSVLSDVHPLPVRSEPAGRRVTALTHDGPLSFSADGDVFSGEGLTLETSGQHSRVALNEQVSASGLLLAFTEVQRAAGLLPLHASVLSRAGCTIAVSGPSGAGKSTAALRLLGRDWQLVAEDWAWLDPLTIQLTGWDRGLRVRPDSLTLFAPEFLQTAPTDAHGKKVLSPPRLPGVHVLNALYFLSRPGESVSPPFPGQPLQAIPSRRAFVQPVWEMVGTPLTPAARTAVQVGVNLLLNSVPMVYAERDELIERLG